MNREEKFINEFQESINSVFEKFPVAIDLKMQGEDLIYKNSPLIGSTAFGYIVESYLASVLTKKSKNIFRVPEDSSVTNLSYDIFHCNDDGKNLINIKVEKNTSMNTGIAAIEQWSKDMSQEDLDTRFYIAKFNYSVDENNNKLIIEGYDLYNVDQIFMDTSLIKSDSRNWSSDFVNKGAGRIQVKNLNKICREYDAITLRQNWINFANEIKNSFNEQLIAENGLVKPNDKTIKKLENKVLIWDDVINNFKNKIG